jgi:hypothetical protein
VVKGVIATYRQNCAEVRRGWGGLLMLSSWSCSCAQPLGCRALLVTGPDRCRMHPCRHNCPVHVAAVLGLEREGEQAGC